MGVATASRRRGKAKLVARSIRTRIYRTVFAACLISLTAAVAVVLVGYEDLERSMLELDFKAERDFVLEHADRQAPLSWSTANLTAFYVPAPLIERYVPPQIFRTLPFPFSGEVEIGNRTFLITLGEVSGGRLYLAKDISLFEEREAMFERLLAAAGLGGIMLSLLLSHLSAKRLAGPLQRLAATIRGTRPEQRMPRLALDFEDAELRAVGEGFNSFLDELEAFVKREHSLLSLASHELRTPIAVISGALEILDQRDQLSAEDKRTLQRVRQATAEMGSNVEVLLKLARRQGQAEPQDTLELTAVLQEVLSDLRDTANGAQRVRLEVTTAPVVVADSALVKMLLRNLLHNALQHTKGEVRVRLDASSMAIIDRGSGLPESAERLLRERALPRGETAALSGLGLYIVTLICQRLNWVLEVESSEQGVAVCLQFGDRPPRTVADGVGRSARA